MKKEICTVLLSAALLIGGFAGGLYFGTNYTKNAPAPGSEQPSNEKLPSSYSKGLMDYQKAMSKKEPAMVFFYVDWCGYCKRFAPLVPSLKKKYKGKINIVMVNCEDASNAEILGNYEVNGYPTVYMVNPQTSEKKYIEAENYYPISNIEKYLDEYLKK